MLFFVKFHCYSIVVWNNGEIYLTMFKDINSPKHTHTHTKALIYHEAYCRIDN